MNSRNNDFPRVADMDRGRNAAGIRAEIEAWALSPGRGAPTLPQFRQLVRTLRSEADGTLEFKPLQRAVLKRLDGTSMPVWTEPDTVIAKRSSQFSRWLSTDAAPWPLSQASALNLLAYLQTLTVWDARAKQISRIQDIPHAYFFALTNALRSGCTTQDNLAVAAPGVYRIWRESILFPRLYVQGLLAIGRVRIDPDTGDVDGCRGVDVLRTIEVHRLSGVLGGCPGEDGMLSEGATPYIQEVHFGYMVKKSRQIMLHAFDAVTRGFQFTVLNHVLQSPHIGMEDVPTRDNAPYQFMRGVSAGVVGQQGFYSVPIVACRVAGIAPTLNLDDASALQHLLACPCADGMGVIPEERLPQFVRLQLQLERPPGE